MPARIVVRLEPTTPRATPPPHTGPAINAAVLAAFSTHVSGELSTALHDQRAYKSFAITPLLDEIHRPATGRSRAARFEVSLLVDKLTAAALTALGSQSTYRIGRTHYQTANVELAAAEPYEQLAATATPATTWAFHLVTPVSFATARGQGVRREHPWPDPQRVFGNLADRWETFAPHIPLPDATRTAVHDHLEIEDLNLRTAEHLVKTGEKPRRGTLGRVTYRLAEPHRLPTDALAAISALSHFATYAGLGDRTAMGMGHTRLLPLDKPSSR